MSSVNINNTYIIQLNLTDDQISAISGMKLYGYLENTPSSLNKFPDITYEEEFLNCKTPKKKIIKMSNTEHINDFFNEGKLQLGTFKYFGRFENPERCDKTEGSCVIVVRSNYQTVIYEIGSGFDNYVFCCYDGEPNSEIIKNFEYNDYFEIIDIDGFSDAIKSSLKAKKSYKSGCLYKQGKVLVSNKLKDFDFSIISPRLIDLVNETKYFIKTKEYKHQNEFRFTWEVDSDVNDPLIIDCMEATKFCKRRITTFV